MRAYRLSTLLSTIVVLSACGCATDPDEPKMELADAGLGGGSSVSASGGMGGQEEMDAGPPAQAVVWLGVSPAASGTCSAERNYQLPEDARATILSTDGVGERAIDGQNNVVACSVKASEPDNGAFDVELHFQGGSIGNFTATGLLSPAGAGGGGPAGTIVVNLNTAQFSLRQRDCTATIDTILSGAIWIRSLSCPALTDPSAPGLLCAGTGGVIFENCSF